MVARIIAWVATTIGTTASILSLVVAMGGDDQSLSAWQIVFLAITIIGFLVLIIWDIVHHFRAQPMSFKNSSEIDDYLYKWISHRGRVVIFSRDMSWAHEERRFQELLEKKAKDGDLTICLPKRIPLVESLEPLGATILTYEELNYEPISRFTIINYGRDGQRIAIGRPIGDRHLVEEFAAGEHPAFSATQDLVEILKRYSSR